MMYAPPLKVAKTRWFAVYVALRCLPRIYDIFRTTMLTRGIRPGDEVVVNYKLTIGE